MTRRSRTGDGLWARPKTSRTPRTYSVTLRNAARATPPWRLAVAEQRSPGRRRVARQRGRHPRSREGGDRRRDGAVRDHVLHGEPDRQREVRQRAAAPPERALGDARHRAAGRLRQCRLAFAGHPEDDRRARFAPSALPAPRRPFRSIATNFVPLKLALTGR